MRFELATLTHSSDVELSHSVLFPVAAKLPQSESICSVSLCDTADAFLYIVAVEAAVVLAIVVVAVAVVVDVVDVVDGIGKCS